MTNLPRFSMTMPQDLIDKVDVYKEENSFSTRSKAIIDLVKAGLEDIKKNGVLLCEITELQKELIDATVGLSDDDINGLIFIAKRLGESQ